jgi:hypothetical protein
VRDERPEGVYCHWETYPPDPYNDGAMKDNILVLERVCGDQSVLSWECARSEAVTIQEFLNGADLPY